MDTPMTREQLMEQLDNIETKTVEVRVKSRAWVLKHYSSLREELAALQEESRQWEKTSLVEILNDRDRLREELAQVKAERDEAKEEVAWYGTLVRRTKIGTHETPYLKAYIEQLEARIAALEGKA